MTQDINSQMVLPLSLDDNASFENYFTGDNHELVHALQHVSRNHLHAVLFFYGASGYGKSHLLFAFQRSAKQDTVASNYLSLADSRVNPEILELVDAQAVVCIDDIHSWAGESDKETAIFALFERIKHAGGKLIASAIQPPESCDFELNDLVSRLNSGLVYPLHPLTDAQHFDAIKLRANQRGLRISDDVVKYLLSRSSRDTSELFQLLDRIDKASLIEKRRITIPFLKSLFVNQS